MRLAKFCLAASLSIAFLATPLHAQIVPQTRLTQPIDNSARLTLGGTVHPLARPANDRGLAPDAMQIPRLQILLRHSDAQEAALKQAIEDMHTPGSPTYHQWLTPEQFGQQFGPSDADVNTLETWLRGQGFTILGLTPGRQVLEVSGSVANFRSAFHADIHQYQVNGQPHFANSSDPQIPAALAPVFGGFAPLNNFHIKSHAKALGHSSYNPVTHQASSDWTISDGSGVDLVLSPQDYAAQYDIPNGLCPSALCPGVTATTNGTGQTIAIINDSNINVYLVNRFRSLFGLPVNPPQVIIDGNDPGVDGVNNPNGPNGDSVEAYLDVEWAGAVAPAATIDLVVAADTQLEHGLYLAMERAIYSNLAPVMSISFGGCEKGMGSDNTFVAGLEEQAAAQGITVMVSTGDAGSAGCDNDNTQSYAVDGQAVNGFASTPYVVAVGGTDFYYSSYNSGSTAINSQLGTYWNGTTSNATPSVSIKGHIPEQPWNDSQYGLNIANYYSLTGATTIISGAGGASTCGEPTLNATTGAVTACAPYPKPSWQTGAGVPADSRRDLPDVSLFASNGINASYYPICATDGDCQAVSAGGQVQIFGVGGTSASSPAFAGLMALINQKYGRQGQADFVLYPLATQYPAAFHDVTAGTITVPCQYSSTPSLDSPNCIAASNPVTISTPGGNIVEGQIGTGSTPEYNATTGYDLATGLGTVDANVLVNDWNKVSFASTTTTLLASSTSFTHGTGVTISGSVTGTGTPTGAVSLQTDSTVTSQQAQIVMPLASGSYSAATNALPGGTYNIWGTYSGDSTNAASASGKTKITVSPESSGILFLVTSGVTSVTAPASPTGATNIPYGIPLTLMGQVAPSTQLSNFEGCEFGTVATCPVFTSPTGTITYSDGSTLLSTASLNSEGDAEFTGPFAVGAHSVTAAYSGDNSYNPSSATAQTFTVIKSTPLLSLNASNEGASGSISSGQATVLNIFAVNNYGRDLPVTPPTGTITLSGVPTGTPTSVTLSAANEVGTAVYGVATATVPAGTSGTYTIGLSYPGDSNYSAATKNVTLQFLAPGSHLTSTTAVTASSPATSPAAIVNLSVTVTGQTGHAAPTGTVTFYSSGFNIGTSALVASGTTTSTVTTGVNSEALVQGNNLISVQYSGDTNYSGSVGTVTVVNTLADFTLIAAANPVVVPSSGVMTDNIAVGSVYGFAGAVSMTCSAPSGVTCAFSSPTATLASGGTATATLNLNTTGVTTAGNYNVLVTGQDSTGHSIHTLAITVNTPVIVTVAPSFALTNSGTVTLATPGAGGSATVTVTPSGGFTGSVALSCSVTSSPTGAAHTPTCSLTSPVSITGTTAGTSTLSINTTANSEVRGAPLERLFGLGGGVALGMLLFMGVPKRRRGWGGLLAFLVMALAVGLNGCGSSSSSVGAPSVTNNGTTNGSYIVTVTGTSGSITMTTPVTVVVN